MSHRETRLQFLKLPYSTRRNLRSLKNDQIDPLGVSFYSSESRLQLSLFDGMRPSFPVFATRPALAEYASKPGKALAGMSDTSISRSIAINSSSKMVPTLRYT